jgi:hypothetical protein
MVVVVGQRQQSSISAPIGWWVQVPMNTAVRPGVKTTPAHQSSYSPPMPISSDGQIFLLLLFLLHFSHQIFLLLTDASLRFAVQLFAAGAYCNSIPFFQEKLH